MGLFRRRKRPADPVLAPPRAVPPPSERDRTESDRLSAEFVAEVERETLRLMAEMERDAARLLAELDAEHGTTTPEPDAEPETNPERPTGGPLTGPSWMHADEWADRRTAYRRQGRTDADIREVAAHLERRGPRKPRTRAEGIARSEELGIVTRAVYVPAEDEARYLTREADGLPTLRLVDSGDRLSIWSPLAGGALLNPKGTGLRRFGLLATYARGSAYYAAAFRAADLRKGRPVELRREPDNPHDKNAVTLHAPGARAPFGYVQRGRAPALARRMDSGESMAGVSLRGPGPRRDDDMAFLLIGSTADLAAMLDG